MKTVTGTTVAWLYPWKSKESPEEFSNLSFVDCDMTDQGYVKVGTATITVELIDNKEIVNGQLSMLNEAKRRVQAEAEKALTEIETQIQSLLAIEYKPCVMTED